MSLHEVRLAPDDSACGRAPTSMAAVPACAMCPGSSRPRAARRSTAEIATWSRTLSATSPGSCVRRPAARWWSPRRRPRPARLLLARDHADYSAALIGELPFFVEVNAPDAADRSAATSFTSVDVVGFCECDRPLIEVPGAGADRPRPAHRRPGRGAHPGRRDASGGDRRGARTLCCERSPTTGSSGCTPSCSATASSTWSRRAS